MHRMGHWRSVLDVILSATRLPPSLPELAQRNCEGCSFGAPACFMSVGQMLRPQTPFTDLLSSRDRGAPPGSVLLTLSTSHTCADNATEPKRKSCGVFSSHSHADLLVPGRGPHRSLDPLGDGFFLAGTHLPCHLCLLACVGSRTVENRQPKCFGKTLIYL